MQRDLGLTREQAETRLKNEAEAGARAGRLQNTLGDRFAGAWVSGPVSATLTVATTDAADTAAIKAGGAEAKVVRHGLKRLEAAKAKLDKGSVRTKTTDAPVWYVDPRTNSVTLEAAKDTAADVFLTATGVERDLVRVKATTERPRPLAHEIRGGDAYYIGTSRCSVGFAVVSGTQEGFATAGHCGQAGAATMGHNKVAQGAFKASTFPGKDMAWVAANAEWTATQAHQGPGRPERRGGRFRRGPHRRVHLPLRLHHRLALRHRRAARHQRVVPPGHGEGPDPHHGLRRAGRLGRPVHLRYAGPGRHLRRLRQLQGRRHHLPPADQPAAPGVRADAQDQRRRSGRHRQGRQHLGRRQGLPGG
jgi:hypothetical protein